MNTWNKFLRAASLVFAIIVLSSTSYGQQSRVNRYSETSFTGTFTSIASTGTYATSGDDNYRNLSMPFDFNYDSVTYSAGTTLKLNTNGWVSFTASTGNASYGNYAGSSSYPATIMPWIGDGYTNDGIYVAVTGTAPNRVLIVEWSQFSWWDWAGDASYTTSMQLKMYETTNKLEFLYMDHDFWLNSVWYGDGGGIGLNGSTSPSFAYKISTASGSEYTPPSDIRWTPAPLPPPPAYLSVQPKSINFGSLLSGQSATQCVTLRASGPGTLIVNAIGISGNPDFTITSSPAALDSFHNGDRANICIQFSPLASGNRTAVVTVSTNGKDSGTQQINISGQGIAPDIGTPVTEIMRKSRVRVGDSLTVAVPIQSTGTGPLTITGWSVTGTNPDQYTVSRYPTTPIPQGTTDSVYITYKPTFEGRADANILINSNALNFPQVSIHALGTGILPRLALSPTALDFDSVFVGQQTCSSVTLYNPGTDTVFILNTLKTSGDYDFTFTPLAHADTIIAPGQQKSFQVCFMPLRNGIRTATIRFYTSIPKTFPDLRDTSQIVLSLSGVGVPYGRLTLKGAMIDTAIVGIQNCVTQTIANTGTADMTVTSAKIIGVDSAEYTFSGITLPVTIAAGTQINITYCLTPKARGTRTASLVLTGMTAGTPATMTLPLGGFGIEVCAQSTPTSAFSNKTMVGKSDTATITVTNCGELATTYTAALPTGTTKYTILGPTTSGTIAPNGTTTFQVVYTPTAIGPDASTLSVTGGVGVTPMSITLGGTGAGVTATASTANAGSVPKGDCHDFTVTITNTGNVDWTPGAATISGPNRGDYTFVSLSPTTIPANGTATLTLRFCPTTTTNESATLTFDAASPTPLAPFSIALSGTGVVNSVSEVTELNGFALGQNYPNPMQRSADVVVTVPQESIVLMQLVDLTGNVVRTITNERMSAGFHTLTIDAHSLPSGTYYYVLTSGETRLMRQLVLTK
jgi:hypothetical protein